MGSRPRAALSISIFVVFPMKKNLRNRVRAGLLVGTVAVLLGSAGLTWRHHTATLRWEEALATVDEIAAQLDSQVDRRPVLWGDTTDELAQPHYDRALSLAPWTSEIFWVAFRAEDEEGRTAREALVAENNEALDAVYRGAHAVDATRRVDWSLGFEVSSRKMMQVRFLTLVCEMKAAILFEEDRDLEAVGFLLDAMQFAGDVSQGPLLIEEMIGGALLSPHILVNAVADGSLRDLSEDAHERLVAGLLALDRRLGWQTRSLVPELVLSMRGLDNAFRGGSGLDWADGQHSGSARDRRLAADHVYAMQEFCEQMDQAFQTGPDALFDELAHFSEQFYELENPISALVFPRLSLNVAYKGRILCLARFRLLAHAVSGAEEPLDPWLAKYLRTEVTEEGTRLWMDHEIFDPVEIHVAR